MRFFTLPQNQPKSEAMIGAPSHFMSTFSAVVDLR